MYQRGWSRPQWCPHQRLLGLQGMRSTYPLCAFLEHTCSTTALMVLHFVYHCSHCNGLSQVYNVIVHYRTIRTTRSTLATCAHTHTHGTTSFSHLISVVCHVLICSQHHARIKTCRLIEDATAENRTCRLMHGNLSDKCISPGAALVIF